jgi:hypothetical protein
MARLVKRAHTKPALFVIDGEAKRTVRVINDDWQKEVPIFYWQQLSRVSLCTGSKDRNRVL